MRVHLTAASITAKHEETFTGVPRAIGRLLSVGTKSASPTSGLAQLGSSSIGRCCTRGNRAQPIASPSRVSTCHVNRYNIVNQVGLIAPDLANGPPAPNPALRPPTEGYQPPTAPSAQDAAQAASDELRYDPQTLERIRSLSSAKAMCKLRQTGLLLRELEDRKKAAVQNEDYDAAKALKSEIERLRSAIDRPPERPMEEAELLNELFGEYLTRCVFSKTWNLRDAALQKLALDLQNGLHRSHDQSRLLTGFVQVLKRMVPDKNVQVFLSAMALLQALSQVQLRQLRRAEAHSAFEPLMLLLVERLGDGNVRAHGGGGAPGKGLEDRVRERGSASYVFMKCLVETFGLELLRADAGVLEISAGKGELACALRNRYQVPVTCAEPRPLDLRRVVQRLRWIQKLWLAPGTWPIRCVGVPFRQLELTEYYTRPEAAASADSSCQQLPAEGEVLYDQPEDAEVDESGPGSDALCPGRAAPACGACTVVELGGGSAPPALAAVRGLCEVCSLVVALHADQAAEAAVRFAAERGKAFAVVPCCAARMDGKN
eukprot:g32259.t1